MKFNEGEIGDMFGSKKYGRASIRLYTAKRSTFRLPYFHLSDLGYDKADNIMWPQQANGIMLQTLVKLKENIPTWIDRVDKCHDDNLPNLIRELEFPTPTQDDVRFDRITCFSERIETYDEDDEDNIKLSTSSDGKKVAPIYVAVYLLLSDLQTGVSFDKPIYSIILAKQPGGESEMRMSIQDDEVLDNILEAIARNVDEANDIWARKNLDEYFRIYDELKLSDMPPPTAALDRQKKGAKTG